MSQLFVPVIVLGLLGGQADGPQIVNPRVTFGHLGATRPKGAGILPGDTAHVSFDVKGLKALDKLTVQVPMTSPYGSFTDQLAYWYYLYIVPANFNPAKPNGTGAF